MRPRRGRRRARLVAAFAATGAVLAIALTFGLQAAGRGPGDGHPGPSYVMTRLPTRPGSYIGVYGTGVPGSYLGVTTFTAATGVRPRLVLYYSGWYEPFQAGFARTAAAHGAVPLVQINPTHISLAAIAAGRYDGYLDTYALAVRAYRYPVILGFGHEMNGDWYTWGYRHASPADFVAAWRHIVTLFRRLQVRNVTWLWTANVKYQGGSISSPARWWPGSGYVTWVGLDGYYYRPSWRFAPLFGPTVAAVRKLTTDPILIAETSAAPTTDQPAKIADLFAGVHLYGLLGFVWFDTVHNKDWRLMGPAAITAFRHGAQSFRLAPP